MRSGVGASICDFDVFGYTTGVLEGGNGEELDVSGIVDLESYDGRLMEFKENAKKTCREISIGKHGKIPGITVCSRGL